MNFLYWKWLPLILIGLVFFCICIFRYERIYFKWINKYWFLEVSKINTFRWIFYAGGFLLLLLSLLDLRGSEERVESEIPDQKTIIIVDASASMLVEDVKPSRFKKSLLMARHFIKKAVGHQIALVLFSDTQKQLVPFTDDIDLLDSRVAGLEDTDIKDGGSNITQALMESLQYFKVESGLKDIHGNILLFTDSEENNETLKLEFPKNVSLGIVGIGTRRGGAIPIRDKYGVFKGYKKYKGEKIISKLNEDSLKKMSNLVSNYNYWVASTYTIPTEEILKFFRKFHEQKLSKGIARIRPVKAQYIIIPSIILLSLANLLSLGRTFKVLIGILILFPLIFSHKLALASNVSKKELPKIDFELWEKHKKGELKAKESLLFAENLLEGGEYEMASILYKENIKSIENTDLEIIMNYAVSLAKSKRTSEALKLFAEVSQRIRTGNYPHLSKKDIQQNIIFALQEKKGGGKGNNSKDKKKGEKRKRGKDQNQHNKDGEQKNKNDEKKNQNENKKNNKRKNEKRDQKLNHKNPKQRLDQKEKEIRKKRKMVKIPAILKQILSNDRKLQKKFIDTSTQRPQASEQKDW